ncbi:putative hemolysin [Saccharopolyspora antimicrobica]|uniref:Hemolysin n=1 Tax=Saccharopolyspora antimicrobica TaxID=455193 RepID=A0A1I4V6M2_9PSEU|nr:hemolysin family protein [Saccharopolyspora antimicrobica]RKT86149.1 putative hemolysin [Saccharopolyspora antimicrobica]SFM96864.1 putative hemolysin [Saccharopolyspora antimicrobica]
MDGVVWNLALVLLFVLFGGYFAAAEIALVSLRDSQVRRLAGHDRRGARVAKLRADSNRFLSAVQIGVTFAGFFASSYGGATIAVRLEPVLQGWGLPIGLAASVALIVVTLFVSYLSLVLGELVPKRLALQKSEAVSLVTAGVLDRLASLSRPVIWLLSKSTNAVVRLLGIDPRAHEEPVSEEELRDMVRTSEQLTVEERRLLSDAFRATDRVLAEVMVPRTEVDFLHLTTTVADAIEEVAGKPHSRYPVIRDTADDVVGFIHVRDLLTRTHREDVRTIGELTRPVTALPASKPVLGALSQMRRSGGHLAVVVDEYGGTAGIVTVEDLVEEVVGEIWDEYDPSAAPVRPKSDGSLEVDGLLHRSDFEQQTGVVLPDGPFDTVAGYVVSRLGRVPVEGDSLDALGHRFTVRAMDGHRVSRILVTGLGDQP